MVSEQKAVGQAGTLESCDCRVTLEITGDTTLSIEVEGPMKDVFGNAIMAVARETLKKQNISGAFLKIMDRGALDYVIEARIEAAIIAAKGKEAVQ